MTPAEKRLAQAIRDRADTSGNTDPELLLVLARVIEGKTLDQALGAPGDWGYGTPIGDALFALLQEPEPERHTYEWHYVTDHLPTEEGEGVAVLVATTSSGQPGEAIFRDDVFLWAGSDIVIPGVYAWAHLPEIPEQRPAATPDTEGVA